MEIKNFEKYKTMKPETLRKKCLKLIVSRGHSKTPRYKLAALMSPGNPENPQALSMALTGYRTTGAAVGILERLYAYLEGVG
jgi:hypothetical protein